MSMLEGDPDLIVDDAEETAPSAGEPGAESRASHLGFVAHEIRNPLSTALWTAELLGRMDAAERGGARGEKLAGMCLRSLQRVRHLVEDFLLSERLDTGLFPIRAEPQPLLDAVVAAEGRRAAAEQPIELQVSPELTVLCDASLLTRILDAILDAATQGVSTAQVTGRRSGGEVELIVRGTTLEPKALEDPLKGATSDTRGRALALPAASRAALRMGGRLEIRDGALVLVLPEGSQERAEEG